MNKKLLLVFAMIFVIVMNFSCDKGESTNQENIETVPVEVKTIERGNVIQSITYNGDIYAEFEVKVFSKIPDRIAQYFVDEGDYVQKGEPVARIFALIIEQSVRQAEAALTAAQAQEANMVVEFERVERLRREQVMSQQQYDLIKTQYEAAKAQVQQSEAALASAKSQLKDATVTAPIAGIIGKRYYENGHMASLVTPLVKIVQMERVKVCFDITEEDLGKVSLGQKTNVKVRSYPDRIFSGNVSKISPVLDPLSRMAEVEVLLDNKERVLKPGMYAEVEVITGILENVLVVPRFAVIESTSLQTVGGKDKVISNFYIFVVEDSIAKQKKLDVVYLNHENLALRSGIEVGDQLVIAGQTKLRENVKISIVK